MMLGNDQVGEAVDAASVHREDRPRSLDTNRPEFLLTMRLAVSNE